jgi:hypothetical protein
MEVGRDERQKEESGDENPKADGNGSLEAHSRSEPSGDEKRACIAQGEKKEGASGQGIADVQIFLEDGEKGGKDCAG